MCRKERSFRLDKASDGATICILIELSHALPRRGANAMDSSALRRAAANGHIEVVKYLVESPYALPRCKANVMNSCALFVAKEYDYEAIVKYVIESPKSLLRCNTDYEYYDVQEE
jgi:Ankyrin repeats (3 copies)